MKESLPKNEGRYVVYDNHIALDDGRKANKLLLIYWCPENMAIVNKMCMSTNKSSILAKLNCQLQINCTDASDVIFSHSSSTKRKLRHLLKLRSNFCI